jgi:cold shock CspA family protein
MAIGTVKRCDAARGFSPVERDDGRAHLFVSFEAESGPKSPQPKQVRSA